jgi:hypothetical protein
VDAEKDKGQIIADTDGLITNKRNLFLTATIIRAMFVQQNLDCHGN